MIFLKINPKFRLLVEKVRECNHTEFYITIPADHHNENCRKFSKKSTLPKTCEKTRPKNDFLFCEKTDFRVKSRFLKPLVLPSGELNPDFKNAKKPRFFSMKVAFPGVSQVSKQTPKNRSSFLGRNAFLMFFIFHKKIRPQKKHRVFSMKV